MLKCKVCGHEWTPRTGRDPMACPRCKSYRWNEGRDAADEGKTSGRGAVMASLEDGEGRTQTAVRDEKRHGVIRDLAQAEKRDGLYGREPVLETTTDESTDDLWGEIGEPEPAKPEPVKTTKPGRREKPKDPLKNAVRQDDGTQKLERIDET